MLTSSPNQQNDQKRPLRIVPLRQPNPDDCSTTCLRMILAFYGQHTSQKEIHDFILKATPDGGSFLTEIARFAQANGRTVDCCAYNLYYTDPADSRLKANQLLSKLRKELQSSQRDNYYDLMLQSTIQVITEGTNYKIQKPTAELIKSYLEKRIPLIVTVNYAALHNVQGDPFESHDIVLHGIEGKYIHFIDPEHAKSEKIMLTDLLFAIGQRKIISASCYLLAIM